MHVLAIVPYHKLHPEGQGGIRCALEVVQVLLGGQAVGAQLLAVLERGLVVTPAACMKS